MMAEYRAGILISLTASFRDYRVAGLFVRTYPCKSMIPGTFF